MTYLVMHEKKRNNYNKKDVWSILIRQIRVMVSVLASSAVDPLFEL